MYEDFIDGSRNKSVNLERVDQGSSTWLSRVSHTEVLQSHIMPHESR